MAIAVPKCKYLKFKDLKFKDSRRSVKFLYSGVKKLYSERCHEEVFWGFSFKNLGKVIYETEKP